MMGYERWTAERYVPGFLRTVRVTALGGDDGRDKDVRRVISRRHKGRRYSRKKWVWVNSLYGAASGIVELIVHASNNFLHAELTYRQPHALTERMHHLLAIFERKFRLRRRWGYQGLSLFSKKENPDTTNPRRLNEAKP